MRLHEHIVGDGIVGRAGETADHTALCFPNARGYVSTLCNECEHREIIAIVHGNAVGKRQTGVTRVSAAPCVFPAGFAPIDTVAGIRPQPLTKVFAT